MGRVDRERQAPRSGEESELSRHFRGLLAQSAHAGRSRYVRSARHHVLRQRRAEPGHSHGPRLAPMRLLQRRSIRRRSMKDHFFALAERLTRAMTGNEIVLCYLSAERSEFVRFNKSRVRQAGAVEQIYLSIRLVSGRRQASATITLSNAPEDAELALATLTRLRETVSQLPDDPWRLIADKPVSTDTVRRG